MRAGRRAAAAALACLAVLLAGCTVGPSQRPPVAVRGEQMPLPPPSAPQAAPPATALPEPDRQQSTLNFRDCTDELLTITTTPPPGDRTLRIECTQITVPADQDQPGLGRSQIGVARVGLADAPADRPALLVVGDSATAPSAVHAVDLAGQVPVAVLERFTLVGIDRRGAGLDELDCAPPDARAAVVDADPAGVGEAGLASLLENARAVVQECYLEQSGALSGYRTASTAGDVERIRVGLGTPRLSAVGIGDGAAALDRWARTNPGAVGRLVLDSPPDPALDEPATSEARAASAEAAFTVFADTCVGGEACPLGDDPRAAVRELVERLRTQPLAASDGRRLTAGMTVTAVLAGLGEPRGWPGLAGALAAAGGGDPQPLLDALDPVLGPGGRFEGALATACNDARRRLTPPEVGELAARWSAAYPLFGATTAQRLLACAPWPASTGAAAPGPPDGLPPVLVVGTARDPRGPLEASRNLAGQLTGAVFLGWQGAGTGAYPRTPCVTAAVGSVLVDGVLPAPDALCPP